jgi:hypothetical protein
MATVLELARHANVSAAQVLRVVKGRPVSGDVRARVERAIETLGPPTNVGPDSAAEVLPAVQPALERARDDLAETFGRAGSELHGSLPEDVGTVVYEALRVEVRPVAEHVSHVSRLVDELIENLAALRGDNTLQRRERLEDLELLTELVTSGWRAVDRRLGRLERMVERLQTQVNGDSAPYRTLSRDLTR